MVEVEEEVTIEKSTRRFAEDADEDLVELFTAGEGSGGGGGGGMRGRSDSFMFEDGDDGISFGGERTTADIILENERSEQLIISQKLAQVENSKRVSDAATFFHNFNVRHQQQLMGAAKGMCGGGLGGKEGGKEGGEKVKATATRAPANFSAIKIGHVAKAKKQRLVEVAGFD